MKKREPKMNATIERMKRMSQDREPLRFTPEARKRMDEHSAEVRARAMRDPEYRAYITAMAECETMEEMMRLSGIDPDAPPKPNEPEDVTGMREVVKMERAMRAAGLEIQVDHGADGPAVRIVRAEKP